MKTKLLTLLAIPATISMVAIPLTSCGNSSDDQNNGVISFTQDHALKHLSVNYETGSGQVKITGIPTASLLAEDLSLKEINVLKVSDESVSPQLSAQLQLVEQSNNIDIVVTIKNVKKICDIVYEIKFTQISTGKTILADTPLLLKIVGITEEIDDHNISGSTFTNIDNDGTYFQTISGYKVNGGSEGVIASIIDKSGSADVNARVVQKDGSNFSVRFQFSNITTDIQPVTFKLKFTDSTNMSWSGVELDTTYSFTFNTPVTPGEPLVKQMDDKYKTETTWMYVADGEKDGYSRNDMNTMFTGFTPRSGLSIDKIKVDSWDVSIGHKDKWKYEIIPSNTPSDAGEYFNIYIQGDNIDATATSVTFDFIFSNADVPTDKTLYTCVAQINNLKGKKQFKKDYYTWPQVFSNNTSKFDGSMKLFKLYPTNTVQSTRGFMGFSAFISGDVDTTKQIGIWIQTNDYVIEETLYDTPIVVDRKTTDNSANTSFLLDIVDTDFKSHLFSSRLSEDYIYYIEDSCWPA